MELFSFFKSNNKPYRENIKVNPAFQRERTLNSNNDKIYYSPETTLSDVLGFIKDNSKRLGIHLNNSASDAEIDNFEQKKFFLPDDFKLLYKFSNGFETDEDLFRLIPLDEVLNNKDDDYLISNISFHFTEYMIYCDMWSVDINVGNKNDYRIYNKTDDTVFLTNSIAEFLLIFVKKGVYDGLYQWREDIKNKVQ